MWSRFIAEAESVPNDKSIYTVIPPSLNLRFNKFTGLKKEREKNTIQSNQSNTSSMQ